MKAEYLYLCLGLCLSILACDKSPRNNPEGGSPRPPAEGRDIDVEEAAFITTQNPIQQDQLPDDVKVLTWENLKDVSFEVRFFEAAGDSLLFPVFGPEVLAVEGTKVAISGYVIPVSYERYVLSANPFSQCFFCGNAGPESVMELSLSSYEGVLFHTDEFRTFQGKLHLNAQEVDKLNYILEDARPL